MSPAGIAPGPDSIVGTEMALRISNGKWQAPGTTGGFFVRIGLNFNGINCPQNSGYIRINGVDQYL